MSTMGLVAKHHGTDIKSTIGASRKMSNTQFWYDIQHKAYAIGQ